MRVLLYSAVLYLLGITIVLYIRPQLMFHRDGRWKEFGVNGIDTTYFPFWLFCIIWAVVAYALVRAFYSDSEPAQQGNIHMVSDLANMPAKKPVAEPIEPLPVPPPPPPPKPSSNQGKPGYYKLDEAILKEKGTPLYVYVGEEKPSDVD